MTSALAGSASLRVALFLLAVSVDASVASAARSPQVSENVPVPGGLVALARALDIAVPDAARCLPEVARLIYGDLLPVRARTHSPYQRLLEHFAKTAKARAVSGDIVPVPLNATVWSRVIFRRTVPTDRLFAAILSDANAALLAYGLAALDDETLTFFLEQPSLLSSLYTQHAVAFASFASHLRIRSGRVIPPGGEAAVPLWEHVVQQRASSPARFVLNLFGSGKGRLAYLYDAIGQLDSARSAFALGLWLPEAQRTTRFAALARVAIAGFDEWHATRGPFSRPIHDLEALFQRVQVERFGAPRAPAGRRFWTAALSGHRAAPDQTSDGDVSFDAAWLAETVLGGHPQMRNARLDQFAFGHRAFASFSTATADDVIAAIAAFSRVPMLMLGLERIGVRHPHVYAALANHAQRVSRLDADRQRAALIQFQAVIVLLMRLVQTRAVESGVAEQWLEELAAMPVQDDGYKGELAAWLVRRLRAAFAASDALPLDDLLVRAMAGPPAPTGPLRFEGQTYIFDLSAAEAARIQRFRNTQRHASLALAMRVHDLASRLHGSHATTRDARSLSGEVSEALQGVPEAKPILGQLTTSQSPDATARALVRAGDLLTADALLSLTYAIASHGVDAGVRIDREFPRRHDFGLRSPSLMLRGRRAWTLPRVVFGPGVPWHIAGSLIGLDVALASQSLRRTSSAPPRREPRMLSTYRESFAASLGLMNAFALSDSGADAIAAAVARGRERVARLTSDAGDVPGVVAAIDMDGWRTRALRWNLAHAPDQVIALFSLTELLYLGGGDTLNVNAWGMSAISALGCLCTALARPGIHAAIVGRPQLGLLPFAVPDLNLNVAVILRELHLPAALARSVLEAALYELFAHAQPAHMDDWFGVVRDARWISRERVEDYLSAATASDGALVLQQPARRTP